MADLPRGQIQHSRHIGHPQHRPESQRGLASIHQGQQRRGSCGFYQARSDAVVWICPTCPWKTKAFKRRIFWQYFYSLQTRWWLVWFCIHCWAQNQKQTNHIEKSQEKEVILQKWKNVMMFGVQIIEGFWTLWLIVFLVNIFSTVA